MPGWLVINLQDGIARVFNASTGTNVTEEILASGYFDNLPRRISVEACAKECNVIDLYNIFYRFLSLDTHGHGEVLTEGYDETTLTIVHLQGIEGLLKGIERVGIVWLDGRRRPDNEELRCILGLRKGVLKK